MPKMLSKKCACSGNDILYFDFKILDELLKNEETNNSDFINEMIQTAKGGKANYLGLFDEYGVKVNNRSLEKLNCKVVVDEDTGRLRLISKKHFKK